MIIRRISAPAPAVSLAEAKAHLRVVDDGDDAMIEGLVAGAIDYLVGWSGVLGRAMEAETVELTLDAFPAGVIELPLGPIDPASVVIDFKDEFGVEQSLTGAALFVGVIGTSGGRVWPRGAWPRTTVSAPDAVRVRWTAGAGASASDKQMILQIVGTGYLHREASGDAGQDVPFSANQRAFATRVWNF